MIKYLHITFSHTLRAVIVLLALATAGAFQHANAQLVCGRLFKSSTAENFFGGYHADGTVWMWGQNDYGQLGDNTCTNRNLATHTWKGDYNGVFFLGDDPSNPVLGGSTGDYQTIAYTQDGLTYTWGKNDYRQLGNNSAQTVWSTPVRVLKGQYPGTTYLGDGADNKVIMVGAGEEYFLAATQSGLVYSWGLGTNGQLGNGGSSTQITPVKVRKGEYSGTTYLGDGSTNKVTIISAGLNHGAAVTEQSQVFAWGLNNGGQLGNNTTANTNTPVRVRKGQYSGTTYLGDNTANTIVQVSASAHATYVLTSGGQIYSWGANDKCQLGNSGAGSYSATPVRIQKGEYNGTTYLGDNSSNPIIRIHGVEEAFFAIATDGTVYALGYNNVGQLGDNSCTDRCAPIRVYKGDCYRGTTYLGDNSILKVIDVSGTGSSGTSTTVFETEGDCKVYTSGYNINGALGQGPNAPSEIHIPNCVKVDANGNCGKLAKSSTSNGHAGIISPDGTMFTWGNGGSGQLGNNAYSNSNTPVKPLKGAYAGTTYLGDVPGTTPGNPVQDAATGGDHTIVQVKDGTVYTFGTNSCGSLGDNTTNSASVPVHVLKGEYPGSTFLGDVTTNKVTMVSAGDHSMALTQNGSVYAWGCNGNGQIGNGGTTSPTTPVRVLKGEYSGTTYLGDNATNPITEISGGLYNSGARDLNGTVYAWGDNSCGQVGNGNTTNQTSPARVVKGQYAGTTYLGDVTTNKILQVSIGKNVSAALATDGTMYTWGCNTFGTLGNNTTANSSAPVRVLKGQYNGTTYLGDNPNNKIVKIAVLNYTIAALAQDGTVYTFGHNNSGQLGDNTTTNRLTPVRVLKGQYPGTTYLGDDPAVKVTDMTGNGTGDASSNALIFITASCKAYAVGGNDYGQFGNGNYVCSYTPVCIGPFNTDLSLPIELSSFEAKLNGDNVDLRWTTASESNSFAIEVERRASLPGAHWERVGQPIRAQGTTSQPTEYSSMDNIASLRQPEPVAVFYRLRMIDLDGSFAYSELREVNVLPLGTKFSLVVSPNPIMPNSQVSLGYTLTEPGTIDLGLYTPTGQLVKTLVSGQQDAGVHEFRLSMTELKDILSTVSSGSYYWRLSVNGKVVTRQVMIAK